MNALVTTLNNEVIIESQFEMLLPIEPLENGMRALNARKLYEVLGSLQHYTDWIKNRIKNRIKKYGFKETFDFIREHKIMKRENTNLLNTRTGYWLTVEMAKELAMIENNDMGTKVRRYFIEMEKKAFEVERLGEVTKFDISETITRIVKSMGGSFISKEAHDRNLALELKVMQLEHEAEIAA
jgi:phage anti-repressor protein